MVRLTYRPDMTLDVYRGRKTTTTQQQQQWLEVKVTILILCPPHRTHVSIMLAQGQGQHLGFHLKPGRIFNITLVTY